jgi:uncharacterized membrane protein YphA (DoxX/SURF4 family)
MANAIAGTHAAIEAWCARRADLGLFAALTLVAVGLCLMFTGGGRYSLDRAWRKAA